MIWFTPLRDTLHTPVVQVQLPFVQLQPFGSYRAYTLPAQLTPLMLFGRVKVVLPPDCRKVGLE
jgi:hypothetical protein